MQRLTFGPISLQHLSDPKRGNSPNSPKPIAPFDSPIKAVKKRRKQHIKMKKEIAEMQRFLSKRTMRDSELRTAKEKLRVKSKQLLRNIDIGMDMSIDDYVGTSQSPPRVQPTKHHLSTRDTKSHQSLARHSKFRDAGSHLKEDPIELSLKERLLKGGSYKSVVLCAVNNQSSPTSFDLKVKKPSPRASRMTYGSRHSKPYKAQMFNRESKLPFVARESKLYQTRESNLNNNYRESNLNNNNHESQPNYNSNRESKVARNALRESNFQDCGNVPEPANIF